MAKIVYEIISISYPSKEELMDLVRLRYDPINISYKTEVIDGRVAIYTFEPPDVYNHKRRFISIKIPCPQNDMALETDEIIEMILHDMAEVLIWVN